MAICNGLTCLGELIIGVAQPCLKPSVFPTSGNSQEYSIVWSRATVTLSEAVNAEIYDWSAERRVRERIFGIR